MGAPRPEMVFIILLGEEAAFEKVESGETLYLYWWPGTGSNRRRRPFQDRLPNRGVDFVQKTIYVAHTKKGRPRRIPMNKPVEVELRS